MRRIRFIFSALLAVLWVAPLSAQQAATGSVRGRVSDAATQEPLAGVSVTVAGRSVLTGNDGMYFVQVVPTGANNVQARLLGYAPMTRAVSVTAGQTAQTDFALAAQAVGLAEMVVTGYGTERAGNLTGAVSTVSDSQFNPGRIISPAQLIQSKVPGVQVVDNNDPGGGLSIRIRGATSVNASSEPLYVVDGVPLGTGAGGGLSAGRDPLNFINPQDIENITVLRDASASAIYGSNAANGVVIITTRTGTGTGHSGVQFQYSGNVSTSTVDRLPSLMNGQQFTTAVTTYAPSRIDSLLGQNTNWFDQITQQAIGQEHNLSLASSGTNMDYRLSLGYLSQEGVVQASKSERVSLGINYNQRLLDNHLTLRTNVRGSRTQDQFTPSDVLGNSVGMAPTQPIYDSTSRTGYWDWNTTNASASNPVASLNLASDHGTTWRSLGNIRAEYQTSFLQGLSANVNLAYDITKADRNRFFPNNLAAQVRQGQGFWSMANNSQGNGLLEMFLNYAPTRTLGPGNLDLVGGYSYNGSHSEYPFIQETGLTSNLLGTNGVPDALNVTNTLSVVDYKLISYFGRANYNIRDRYLAAVTFRRDGSSRFGPGNQWGTFPSVAAAWRISEESFMPHPFSLSDLKLRASWASTGNQAFGDYLSYPTYTYSDGLTRVQFGNQFVTTIRPSAVDEFIHWEKTASYNLGLDYGFANQRFSGALEFYNRNTDGLIFTVPVAAGTTLSNYVTTNIGSMKNTGFEFNLDARMLEAHNRSFEWTASFTASHNTNELKTINPNLSVARILTGNISGGVGNLAQVYQPGVPIQSFFMLQQRYDANGKPIYTPNAGIYGDTAMYVDQATVLDSVACGGASPAANCVGLFRPDGQINDQDRRPYHDPAPKWILGFSNYFSYHNFDASFTLRANIGNYVYNNVASSNGAYQNLNGSGMPSNLHTSVLETGFGYPQYYSDYFVEDASFLRMDNITIGYTFNYNGQPFRLYGTVQNAFTITGYSGVDATVGVNGLDNNIYPRSRTFTTGLSVQF